VNKHRNEHESECDRRGSNCEDEGLDFVVGRQAVLLCVLWVARFADSLSFAEEETFSIELVDCAMNVPVTIEAG
jgi:hypothetical protein